MPHQPVILGIVGDSAAGKTTLANGITTILGADRVTILALDDYHRYNRAQRHARNLTALHPDCNDIDLMEQHLCSLRAGAAIHKPVYDHSTGDFADPVQVVPNRFIIVEGLLAFATPRLRECCDIKVFLDPPEELRRLWKISRDCAWRGYTPEQVQAQLDLRASDAEEFIRPQRHWADMVVRFMPGQATLDPTHLNVQLTLRATLPYPDLSDLIAQHGYDFPVLRQRVGRDEGRLTEFLEIDGRMTSEQAQVIQGVLWDHLLQIQRLPPEQLGIFLDGRELRQSHPLGLTQLLVAHQLLVAQLENEQSHY